MDTPQNTLVYVDFQERRKVQRHAAADEFAEWAKNFARNYDLERLYATSGHSELLVKAVVELVECA